MRTTIKYLILIFFSFYNGISQMPVPEFEIKDEKISIPFEVSESKIFFRAKVNGIEQNLILDSGAGNNHVMLENGFAKELGMTFQPPLPNGLGLGENKQEVAIGNGLVEIEIPGLKVSAVPVRISMMSIQIWRTNYTKPEKCLENLVGVLRK